VFPFFFEGIDCQRRWWCLCSGFVEATPSQVDWIHDDTWVVSSHTDNGQWQWPIPLLQQQSSGSEKQGFIQVFHIISNFPYFFQCDYTWLMNGPMVQYPLLMNDTCKVYGPFCWVPQGGFCSCGKVWALARRTRCGTVTRNALGEWWPTFPHVSDIILKPSWWMVKDAAHLLIKEVCAHLMTSCGSSTQRCWRRQNPTTHWCVASRGVATRGNSQVLAFFEQEVHRWTLCQWGSCGHAVTGICAEAHCPMR
jgi:hypothetical protein